MTPVSVLASPSRLVADSLTSPPGQRSISDAAGYLLACLSARHRDPTFAPSCLWK